MIFLVMKYSTDFLPIGIGTVNKNCIFKTTKFLPLALQFSSTDNERDSRTSYLLLIVGNRLRTSGEQVAHLPIIRRFALYNFQLQ